MSLVEELAAATPLEGLLGHRPELLAKYRSFVQSFWQDGLLPRRTLEVCRLRIAYIHDCEAELHVADGQVTLSASQRSDLAIGDFTNFVEAECAALELAELIPFNVHMIDDHMIARVDSILGHPGCVALLTALSFFDVNCRLKSVLQVPVQEQTLSATTLP